MNQSEFDANTCNRFETLENVIKQVTIGFVYFLIGRESDTQLKTALVQAFCASAHTDKTTKKQKKTKNKKTKKGTRKQHYHHYKTAPCTDEHHLCTYIVSCQLLHHSEDEHN